MRTILLTGVTGVIGSAVLPWLLREEGTRILLIIRAKQGRTPQEALEKILSFYELHNTLPWKERTHIFCGDVSRQRFGLSDAEYRFICQNVGYVIHCAANVKLNMTLHEARTSATMPVRQVMQLLRDVRAQGRTCKLDYVSTVGVGGCQKKSLREEPVTEPRRFHNTYEEAKAQAEDEVLALMREGYPVTIHRPSMVVGDSKTGRVLHFQVFYFLCRFFSGTMTRGWLPRPDNMTLDVVPVDYVARAIYLSSLLPESRDRIFHLCSGPHHSLDMASLIHFIRADLGRTASQTYRLKYCSLAVFRVLRYGLMITAREEHRTFLTNLPWFLSYMRQRQIFENTKTLAFFEQQGCVLPKVGDYLEKIWTYHTQR